MQYPSSLTGSCHLHYSWNSQVNHMMALMANSSMYLSDMTFCLVLELSNNKGQACNFTVWYILPYTLPSRNIKSSGFAQTFQTPAKLIIQFSFERQIDRWEWILILILIEFRKEIKTYGVWNTNTRKAWVHFLKIG